MHFRAILLDRCVKGGGRGRLGVGLKRRKLKNRAVKESCALEVSAQYCLYHVMARDWKCHANRCTHTMYEKKSYSMNLQFLFFVERMSVREKK